MAKYKRKQPNVEAVRLIGFTPERVAIFDFDEGDHPSEWIPSWVWGNWQNRNIRYPNDKKAKELYVVSLKRMAMVAKEGDYIIRLSDGSLYVSHADEFESQFEPAAEVE